MQRCGSSEPGICGSGEVCEPDNEVNCATCLGERLGRKLKLEHTNLNAEDGSDQYLLIKK